MAQVEKVEVEAAQHFLHCAGITVVQGGVRRGAGPELIERGIARVALENSVDVILSLGPGPDKRHVAPEYIVELGQLVEVTGAQKAACARDAGVVTAGAQPYAAPLGVGTHGAELINGERASVAPDALLSENHGASVLAPDCYGAQGEQRGRYYKRQTRQYEIGAPLGIALKSREVRGDIRGAAGMAAGPGKHYAAVVCQGRFIHKPDKWCPV